MKSRPWVVRIILLTLILFLAMLPLVFSGPATAQEKEDTALFYKGQSLMEKKQPAAAAAKFNTLLKKFPRSNIRDLAFYWLGRAYLDLGQISEAEGVFKQLQGEFSGSPLAPRLKKEIARSSAKPPERVVKPKPPRPPKVAEKPMVTVKKQPEPSIRKRRAPPEEAPRKTRPPTARTLPIPSAGIQKGFILTIKQVADLEIESEVRQLSVYPGKSGRIPFRITNTGNGEDSFHLRTTLPPEYQPEFYMDKNNNGRVNAGEPSIQGTPVLDVQRSIAVILKLRLPQSMPDGQKKEFELLVSSMFDPNISRMVKAGLEASGPAIRAVFEVDRRQVEPGDRLHYTLHLRNSGSAEAREVKFQYAYHPDLIFLSAQPTPNIVEQASRSLVWQFDKLPSQASRKMEIQFKVGDEATAGQNIVNLGSLEISAGGEPTLLASPLVSVRQVAMIKLEGPKEEMAVTPGDVLNLPYIIKNMGNGPDAFSLQLEGDESIEAIVYIDENQDGLYQSSESVLTNTPSMGSREASPVMVRIHVPVQQPDGKRLETRLIARSRFNPDISQEVFQVLHYMLPIVTISTQQDTKESIPGGIISYQLIAINSGSGIARNVVVTDLLPQELEYVNSDPQPTEKQEGGLIWRVAELAPNQKKVFVVNVKARLDLRAGTAIQKETRIRYMDLNGNRYQ